MSTILQNYFYIGLLHLKNIHPLIKSSTRAYDFQLDWLVEQLHLKFTTPLCNILVQSTTEGVHISFVSHQWANLLEMDTFCVNQKSSALHIMQWFSQLSDVVFTPKIKRKFFDFYILWIKTNVAYTRLEMITRTKYFLMLKLNFSSSHSNSKSPVGLEMDTFCVNQKSSTGEWLFNALGFSSSHSQFWDWIF